MKTLHHPDRKDIELTSVLYALSDPVRLVVVTSLCSKGDQPCGTIELPVAKSTASHHFKVLRECGVIHVRQDGTQRCMSLRREDLDSRFPGLLDAVLESARTKPRRRK
jgi:DNA-binding transcriptional ArsR family regulator